MTKFTIKPTLRVKEIAKEKGITLKYIADKLGVDPAAISQSISGNPTIIRLQEIANILGVPVSELIDEPKSGNFTCPNCGAEIILEGKLADGTGRMPDHENIRGADYYK